MFFCPALVITCSPSEAYISNISFQNVKVELGQFVHFHV